MKKYLILLSYVLLFTATYAQDNHPQLAGHPERSRGTTGNTQKDLPDLNTCMHTAQQNLPLFTQSLTDPSQANDVNSIIKDIESYIDSIKKRTYSDQLLMKYFLPLRRFFLTTTNKTSVAAEFLYTGTPYSFCMYNDTALTLYIGCVKDDEPYNLSKMTDKRIAQKAFERCLLPSLAALDSFKDGDIKYIALSIYYGCKDTREGAPTTTQVPYCLTLIARLTDIQQYVAGLITGKGLMANAEVYLADEQDIRRLLID